MSEEYDPNLDSIERSEHDGENPYVQILNALIRDNRISPDARILLCRLLTNKSGWRINTRQVYEEFKSWWGRDRVRKIFNELIEAGYMERIAGTTGKNNLIRYRYKISETPRFKKFLRCTEIQYPEATDPENQSYKKEHLKEEYIKEQQQPTNPQKGRPASPDVVRSFSQENEKREFLKKYSLPVSVLESFMDVDLKILFDASLAFDQYAEKNQIDNPHATLTEAIKKHWKPNSNKTDKIKQKQELEEAKIKQKQENREYARVIIEKNQKKFTSSHRASLCDTFVELKQGKGMFPLSYLDPKFKELIEQCIKIIITGK